MMGFLDAVASAGLSGAMCRLAYGPADATATQCLLLQQNRDWFHLFGSGSLG